MVTPLWHVHVCRPHLDHQERAFACRELCIRAHGKRLVAAVATAGGYCAEAFRGACFTGWWQGGSSPQQPAAAAISM